MKIAVSGSAGTGKSSLAKALAERLNLPLIAENYEPLLDKSRNFTRPDQVAAPIMQIFQTKKQLEEKHGSFVTDRCAVDLFHFWMKMNLSQRQQETEQLYNMAMQQTAQYDLLVIPPWGKLNINNANASEDPSKRTSNRYVQMYNHASIAGLAGTWVHPDRLLFLPNITQSVDERVEDVLKTLKVRGLL